MRFALQATTQSELLDAECRTESTTSGKTNAERGSLVMILHVGPIGSDAGYWYIGADGKLHHVEGWGVEVAHDVQVAVAVLQAASRFRTPGLTDAVTREVAPFIEKHLAEQFGAEERVALA